MIFLHFGVLFFLFLNNQTDAFPLTLKQYYCHAACCEFNNLLKILKFSRGKHAKGGKSRGAPLLYKH